MTAKKRRRGVRSRARSFARSTARGPARGIASGTCRFLSFFFFFFRFSFVDPRVNPKRDRDRGAETGQNGKRDIFGASERGSAYGLGSPPTPRGLRRCNGDGNSWIGAPPKVSRNR